MSFLKRFKKKDKDKDKGKGNYQRLNDDDDDGINTSSLPLPLSSTQTEDYKEDKTEKVRKSLVGKSTREILELLKNKYPNPPKYIDLSQFKYASRSPHLAIDTTSDWSFVIPQYSDNTYTGHWNHALGETYNDYFIAELLSNENGLKEATIPSNGGRRPRRFTRVKSKKRANKRRTRSRK